MKEKILPFIIGFLVGAIIATGCFYLYSKTVEATIPESGFSGGPEGMGPGGRRDFQKGDMENRTNEDGERPELPDGMNETGERPEMPNGEKPEGEPPAKPDEADLEETTNTNEV